METMNDEKSGCKLCATFIYLSDSECTCSEKAAEATAALLVSACAHPSLACDSKPANCHLLFHVSFADGRSSAQVGRLGRPEHYRNEFGSPTMNHDRC